MPATTPAPAPPRPLEQKGRGGLRRDLGVGVLLAVVTTLAMLAGGALEATPAGAAVDPGRALVLQCPLGVHRVALPGEPAGLAQRSAPASR